MKVINIEKLLTDHLGKFGADVYLTQASLNQSFAHDYHVAYAYGPESEPQRVHERVAAIGAEQLGISVEDYLRVWDDAVAVIMEVHNTPEEFVDPTYFMED